MMIMNLGELIMVEVDHGFRDDRERKTA